MGYYSGSVYVFVRRDDGTWEEEHKLTPADGEAGGWFGYSVSIHGETAIIGANGDDDRESNSGSGYLYTNIDGKWIETGKIFPEDGSAYEEIGTSVSILMSTALFGDSNTGE